ncbi:MAG TPA: hypothetical protein VNJ03_15535 [Vicinamibacterales bacterium]|nr:hypothetical protein [Vicinamibacterales bacterium]
MFSTVGRFRPSPWLLIAATSLCLVAEPALAQPSNAPLFRIFLRDGGTLVSYGEYARVSDRVVFSVPLGATFDTPKLQLISIPERSVDWLQTDDYAIAVRAKRYADTRGEDDFAMLAGQVTGALKDIALAPDAKRRVAMAEEARRNLAAWPAANHGYRAADVAQLVSMLDDVVAEMRVSAGMNEFDLSLVATTTPAPPVTLMPPPDQQQSIESAFQAALVTGDASDRMALLRGLKQELGSAGGKESWANALATRVALSLASEVRIENAYGDLVRRTLQDASQRAARADVKGLQRAIATALGADERLGRQRPGEMAGLLAVLDLRLDEARRLRLAQDSWLDRLDDMKIYRAAIAAPRGRIAGFTKWLGQIQELSGPDRRHLRPLGDRAELALRELNAVRPPPELQGAHGLFAASLQMTRQAASLRRTALSSNDIKLAWDASSAAAGALMLAERAADELKRTMSSASTPSSR